ncbi:MAG TPA: DinB family protein [Gemmatimonadaceae bacterium]
MNDDSGLQQIRRLWQHSAWADRLMLGGLQRMTAVPPDALREFAHVFGAQEVWLSRLEHRASALPVWPTISVTDPIIGKVIAGFEQYLSRLDAAGLDVEVHYTNTAGKSFDTPVSDILLHVAMHGQYHRGKVNVHLRAAGLKPIPTDFITFVRGVPAATTPRNG